MTWKAAVTLFSDWFAFLSTHAADQAWQIIGMILFVGALIVGPLRAALFFGISRLSGLENPTPLQRSLYAVWAVFVYTMVPFATLAAVTLVLDNAELLPKRIKSLAELLAIVVFITALSYGLIRVLLAPKKPNFRLLNIEDSGALKIYSVALGLLVVFTIDSLSERSSSVLLTPLETSILIQGICAILTAIFVWAGLRLIVSVSPHIAVSGSTAELPDALHSFYLPGFVKVLQPLIWLTCLVIFIAPILGYVSLGSFLAEQMGRIFIILALLGIVSPLVDNFLAEKLETQNRGMQSVSRAMAFSRGHSTSSASC